MFIVILEHRKLGTRVWCVDDGLCYWGEKPDKYIKRFASLEKAEKLARAVGGKAVPE